MPDVITFGEAMVRLAPPSHRRLEQTRTLDITVGGAELDTAVGVARLGHSCSWVSRLTDNALGRLIANHAREAGVSTEACLWTPDDRVGLYFYEFGAAPRPPGVLYDRKDSAFANVRPGMFDWPRVLAGAKWFHITGITPAVGAKTADATREALEAARAVGVRRASTSTIAPNCGPRPRRGSASANWSHCATTSSRRARTSRTSSASRHRTTRRRRPASPSVSA